MSKRNENRTGYKKTKCGWIPDKWECNLLGKCLSKIIGGGTPSKNIPAYWNGTIPWATVKDLSTGEITDTIDHISTDGLENSSANLIPKRTIILSTRMAVGSCIRFEIDTAINQDLKALFHNSKLTNDYLYWFIKGNQGKLERLGSGSTVGGIRLEDVKSFKIPLPPLPEQKKIAEILSTWDRAIERTQKLIDAKQRLKKGLMQQLLIGRMRFPEFGKPVKNKGELPEGWRYAKCRTFAKLTAGGTPSTRNPEYWNGDIPWMNSGELNLKHVQTVAGRITEEGLNNSSTKYIPKHSVLIGLAGQGKTRGTAAINEIELCVNQSIAAIMVDPKKAHYKYLFFNIDSRYDELRRLSTGDGGRGGLNLALLGSLRVLLPSIEEQKKISKALSGFDESSEILQQSLKAKRQMKKGLMQKLLTGEIRVKT